MLPIVIAIIKTLRRTARKIGHHLVLAAEALHEATQLNDAARHKYPYID